MDAVESISLVGGWLPPLVWVVGIIGLIFLVLPRQRRRWWLAYPLLVLAAALVTWVIYLLLVYVWFVIADPLPLVVIAWAGLALFGILLGVYSASKSPWTWKLLATLATIAVVLLAGLQLNAYFGQYVNVRSLLGDQVAVQALPPNLMRGGSGTGSQKIPMHGTVSQASIPGTVSKFTARDAIIYLPPAYEPSGPRQLPVLVLVAGQPGGPQRWLDAGHLPGIMDSFAAAHHGMAPVVVVADPNETTSGNSMCMDSDIAQADTYLSADVPAWITKTLNVQRPSQGWAFGGFSFGGTCALQMGTLHPQLYPNIIDLSGQQEPALSVSRTETIDKSFGGNTAAFESRLPLTLLHHQRFPSTHAFFSVGASDHQYGPDMEVVVTAARAAGMQVKELRVPGAGHSWAAARAGLTAGLDFLAPHWGMVR